VGAQRARDDHQPAQLDVRPGHPVHRRLRSLRRAAAAARQPAGTLADHADRADGRTAGRRRAESAAQGPRRRRASRPIAGSALTRDPVATVLRNLRAYAAVEDELAKERVRAREAELGAQVGTGEKYALYGAAPPLAVSSQVGDLLYLLTRARRPLTAVEFGTSHGISTIYLAAALRDAGSDSLITSELLPEKAAAAGENLVAAELDDIVELRVGDALQTLRELPQPVELLFLDGRNDLYLDVLRLVEPSLARDALVLADLSLDDPDLVPYLNYVRAEGSGYASLTVPFGAGLEVSLRSA
jgi:predicted O-methyltransferase YrrM